MVEFTKQSPGPIILTDAGRNKSFRQLQSRLAGARGTRPGSLRQPARGAGQAASTRVRGRAVEGRCDAEGAVKNFFVSYNRADRVWAEWIAWTLEEAGYSALIRAWDFRPGANFVLEMHKASEQTQKTILVLSEDYLKAEFTKPEWAAAFVRDPDGQERALIPVRVKECKPTGLLAPVVYVDLVGLGEPDARAAVLGAFSERAKPAQAPIFPTTAARQAGQRAAALPVRYPGKPWNVPYARNPFFTGREKILQALRAALEKRGTAALSGLGGVGKTQTAAEYAYRYRNEYESVFWARADSRDALLASFVSIATVLNLPESTATEQEAAVGAVKWWLEANPGWLLVLDNADDLPMAREFIPQDAQGHMLLTTRAQATAAIAERVEIEEMEPAEGALFLLRRAGVIAKDQPVSAASAAERKLAEQISKELGGLPLALDQAGAFIEEAPSSLAEYLEFYRSAGAKLRAERGGLGDHTSVAITFSLAFNKVAEASAAAADLVRVCAFFAPDAIPEEIFSEGEADLGENLATAAKSPLAFAQVFKEAGRFSLIDRTLRTRPSTSTVWSRPWSETEWRKLKIAGGRSARCEP